MKNLFKYFVIIFVSFVFATEMIGYVKAKENILNNNYQRNNYFETTNKHSVYLIGDSFASTNYVDQGYPVIFKEYFKKKKWNFYDLSKQGTALFDHKILLDSLSQLNPKLIIYFYNYNDIVSLNTDLLFIKNEKELKNGNDLGEKIDKGEENYFRKSLLNLYYYSKTIILFKMTSQYISLKFTDRYLPSTPAYMFPKEHLEKKDELKQIFDSIKADNKLILINTPFNAGAKPKKWEQYQVFNDINNLTKYDILQTVDYVSDPKYGVSWKNAHPTQEAIKIIADSLIRKIDLIQ